MTSRVSQSRTARSSIRSGTTPRPPAGGCAYCKNDGHRITSCPIIRCRLCGEIGHTATSDGKGCPLAERAGRCDKCGRLGHDRSAECTRCGKHGHIAKECLTPACGACGKLGHLAQVCTTHEMCDHCKKSGHSSERCWFCERCQKYGHSSARCTLPECEACGKIGHPSERCWFCDFCDIHGHKTEDCFIRKNQLRLEAKVVAQTTIYQCADCLEFGHTSDRCSAVPWCHVCHSVYAEDDHPLGACPRQSEHRCSFCGEVGHLDAICPSPAKVAKGENVIFR